MIQLDSASEALLQDPAYLLRLHAKTAELLTTRTKDGTRVMAANFEMIDGRYRRLGERVDTGTLLTIARSIFPMHLLSDRELRILLHVLPIADDDDNTARSLEMSGADPVRLFSALRRIVPCAAWQLSVLAAKARAAVDLLGAPPGLELHLRDVLAGHPVPPVGAAEALRFLMSAGGLSASGAELVVEYCADEGEGSEGSMDAALLHGLLFEERLPSTIEYPILAARFAEATAEVFPRGGSPATGSLALLDALRAALAVPSPRGPRHADEVAAEADIDFPAAVMDERLTGRQFFDVCRRIGTTFLQEQSDRLYFYLTAEPSSLAGASVVHMFRQFFPAVSGSQLQVVIGALRRGLATAGGELAFHALYARLEDWGSGPLPLDALTTAVRASGVAQAAVPDLAVEWVRLKATSRVDLISVLCMPVPPSREAVIRKLFERLDQQQRGVVAVANVLAQFNPERIEGAAVRANAIRWKVACQSYLGELGEPLVSYELFAFFWYMLSAAVEDDPTYTMVVWQGFSLTDRRPPRR